MRFIVYGDNFVNRQSFPEGNVASLWTLSANSVAANDMISQVQNTWYLKAELTVSFVLRS